MNAPIPKYFYLKPETEKIARELPEKVLASKLEAFALQNRVVDFAGEDAKLFCRFCFKKL